MLYFSHKLSGSCDIMEEQGSVVLAAIAKVHVWIIQMYFLPEFTKRCTSFPFRDLLARSKLVASSHELPRQAGDKPSGLPNHI